MEITYQELINEELEQLQAIVKNVTTLTQDYILRDIRKLVDFYDEDK